MLSSGTHVDDIDVPVVKNNYFFLSDFFFFIPANLCKVGVHVGVVGIALEILAVDQALDALLQVLRLDGKLELLKELVDEQDVAQLLARLHHTNDRGVHLELAVLEHTFGRVLLFFHLK